MIRLQGEDQQGIMPVCVLGCEAEGRANYTAVGWICRVNGKPPMIGFSLGKGRFGGECIEKTKVFSINYLGTELWRPCDHAGVVSGRNEDKSGLFESVRGEVVPVPLVKGAQLALECSLAETVILPSHIFYIGEIEACWGDETLLDEKGHLDFSRAAPLLLTMPDCRYFATGPALGRAFDPASAKS